MGKEESYVAKNLDQSESSITSLHLLLIIGDGPTLKIELPTIADNDAVCVDIFFSVTQDCRVHL